MMITNAHFDADSPDPNGVTSPLRTMEDRSRFFDLCRVGSPDFLPCCKFAWPELIPGEVSFVQVQEFGLGHVPELFTLRFRNVFLHPGGDVRGRSLPTHSSAHHIAHDLSQAGAVFFSNGAATTERLA